MRSYAALQRRTDQVLELVKKEITDINKYEENTQNCFFLKIKFDISGKSGRVRVGYIGSGTGRVYPAGRVHRVLVESGRKYPYPIPGHFRVSKYASRRPRRKPPGQLLHQPTLRMPTKRTLLPERH